MWKERMEKKGSLEIYKASKQEIRKENFYDNHKAPPPSYQSLFGQVREVHKTSNGVLDFLRSVILLLLGTLGCSILVGVTVIIPVSMIVIGCVWVYRAYPPDYTNIESPAYCDRTLYLFAFGLVTAGLLSLGLVAACLCCLTLFSLLSSKD
ncbi:hypothetical protein HPB51_017087 [Rhipicephalus microplus]|uniref:Uncharacterized protein n=1 Tax=Rhipicephalus microplus TaxID=6941 RepID=A0A9J6F4C0_RHIMP|nr:hypothetical protein HPB51_017087 [Rhipicephalus microplus]